MLGLTSGALFGIFLVVMHIFTFIKWSPGIWDVVLRLFCLSNIYGSAGMAVY